MSCYLRTTVKKKRKRRQYVVSFAHFTTILSFIVILIKCNILLYDVRIWFMILHNMFILVIKQSWALTSITVFFLSSKCSGDCWQNKADGLAFNSAGGLTWQDWELAKYLILQMQFMQLLPMVFEIFISFVLLWLSSFLVEYMSCFWFKLKSGLYCLSSPSVLVSEHCWHYLWIPSKQKVYQW